MKLRTKLLLGVGLLLFVMIIMMYILPTFFVRRDVYKAADEIHELLISEHQQMVHSQQLWLANALENIKENNDALLLMLYEEPLYRSQLIFNSKNSDKDIWMNLARIIGYDPSIGFIQVHAPDMEKAAVISPNAGVLYQVDKISKQDGVTLISLLYKEQEKERQFFVGLPLPKEMQKEAGYTLYILFSSEMTKEKLQEIYPNNLKHWNLGCVKLPRLIDRQQPHISNIESLTIDQSREFPQPKFNSSGCLGIREATVTQNKEFNKNEFAVTRHIMGSENNQPASQWALKIDLIRTLTPFYAEGLSLSKNGSERIPEGLVRVDEMGNGVAILSKDIYSTVPLFDDAIYYKLHQPDVFSPPLAAGTAIVAQPEGEHAYVGNTLLLENTYLSIAAPLRMLARQLALTSNRMVLLMINHQFWIGFDGQGNKLSLEQITQIIKTGAFEQKSGILEVGKHTFFFSRVSSLENDNLVFFDFHSVGDEKSIVSTLLSLEDKLSSRISTQLSLISLLTMLLVLLFIGRIGFTVIYPVTKLANATQSVIAGRYDEVVLPDVGNRQDEVAILTRSFGDMVEGLQEREKIRGVLDKVVSKDIADEILRTHIHLGGEDRIVTMLFCDIRGFTTLTANVTPQKTIQLLNACMTKVSRVIEGEGGIIDKYVGDEVMAIFGAPTGHPDHALRAVSTGMLIMETLKKWNQTRIANGEPPIEMGIGIHTGLVVAGNMGAEDRLNYTVLGWNVNLAARLCEVAKPNQLIISGATLSQPNIKESFYTQPLPPITPKGFVEPVQIYEISGFKWG